jgi:hypothetical protein
MTVTPSELDSFEGLPRHRRDPAALGDPKPGWGPIAKRVTWMVLIAASFLFLYLLFKLEQALSLL